MVNNLNNMHKQPFDMNVEVYGTYKRVKWYDIEIPQWLEKTLVYAVIISLALVFGCNLVN